MAIVVLSAAACSSGSKPVEVTPAKPGAIVALGDVGASAAAEATFKALATAAPEVVLALGDLSYDEIKPESAWCAWLKQLVGTTPVQLVAGNHEEDGGPNGDILDFAKCLPDQMGSSGSYPGEYYFDVGAVRVIMVSPDLAVGGTIYDFGAGATDYLWLEATLNEARSDGLWTIVGMHKNCITVGQKRCEIGEDIANLLAAQADLVVQGHDHTYQRSHQLTCVRQDHFDAACVADRDGDFQRGAGAVFVISGAVGRSLYDVDANDPEAGYFATWMGGNTPGAGDGYLQITPTEDQLSVEWIGVTTSFSDSFVIHR